MERKRRYLVLGCALVLLGVSNALAAKSAQSSLLVRKGRSYPSVSSFSPTSKMVGEAAFTLTVNGANFGTGAVLLFNSAPRATTVVSPTQLTAEILAADLANAGNPLVVVSNTDRKTCQAFYVVNKANTSTALSSSANPSQPGEAVTFTATISAAAPSSGTPSGTVTFLCGTNALATKSLSGGQAAFTTASLPPGANWLMAMYNGDGNYKANTNSPALGQKVGADIVKVGSATTLSSSTAMAAYGQTVTFTAKVKPANSSPGTPSGTVSLMDGDTSLGFQFLAAGQAVFTLNTLSLGAHSLTAVYNGDDFFDLSTSAVLTETIKTDGSTTVVSSSANPSVCGQSVTFTARVNPVAPGSGTPSGTVTFMNGTNMLGTGTLSSGQATFTTSALSVGLHAVVALYGGDGNFATNTSVTLAQAVNKATSTTSLAASPNPSVAGQPVTFTASVSAVAPGSGTPTGTVTFKDGTTALGTSALSGGQAGLIASLQTSGAHTITAVYGGDGNFNGSISAALTENVTTSSNGGKKPPATTDSPSSSLALAASDAGAQPVMSGIARHSDGNMRISASGVPGQNYVVQATTDLRTWATIGAAAADSNGHLDFLDLSSRNYPSRFYRLVQQTSGSGLIAGK